MLASVECLNASCSAEENWPAPEATRNIGLVFLLLLSREQEMVRNITRVIFTCGDFGIAELLPLNKKWLVKQRYETAAIPGTTM